jgi:hypothetical protein
VDPTHGGYSSGVGAGIDPDYTFTNLCTKEQQSDFYMTGFAVDRIESSSFLSGTLPIGVQSNYFYPFDERSLDLDLQLDVQSQGQITVARSISPDIAGWTNTPGWDAGITTHKQLNSVLHTNGTSLHIIFQRPLGTRVLTIILLLALTALIAALVFVTETSSFLEVAAAILLGLWQLHSTLVPANITWPTIIDPILLVLYILFALVVCFRLAVRPLWQRLSSRPPIPAAAEPQMVRISPDTPMQITVQDVRPDVHVTNPPEALDSIQRAVVGSQQRQDRDRQAAKILLGLLTILVALLHLRWRDR